MTESENTEECQNEPPSAVCQRIRINGIVQGVGFRPLVWRLARELELSGWVRNDSRGVEIEVCGTQGKVADFIRRLHQDAPPLARIDTLTSRYTDSVSVSRDFFILDSRGGRAATMIAQDTVVCRDCLREMFDPEGRRWRYAFSNCGHCGPRYTICTGLPFDRQRTSLKAFAMCGKCRAEYARPNDRRLHAEGNCCAKCGPQLTLLDADGSLLAGDVIAQALTLLQDGKIVAIKGPGGFHLACDARNPAAVARMREHKGHQDSPFPVMFAAAPSAIPYVQFRVGEPGLLNLPERPIILLKKRPNCDKKLPGVAPGLAWLGVMLPVSPIHYLLFHEAAGRPSGIEWLEQAQDLALLMSSGNRNSEPVCIDNQEALTRLSGLADAFIMHDREIVTRCDDSVARSGPGGLQIIRRSRGYAPRAIKLPYVGPPVLAVGGPVKNTVCITRGDEAFISQNIGELSNPAAFAGFEKTITHLLKMLEVTPTLLAHDLFRDSYSSAVVEGMARQYNIPMLAIQHHHAHIAAILAEHRLTTATYGLALDGGEPGIDGTCWGGELLLVDGARFERVAHLLPLSLPINDTPLCSPWRFAAAILHALGRQDEICRRFPDQPQAAALAARIAAGENCQPSSSLGRLFDAAAGILTGTHEQSYRDQGALLLEGLAESFGETEPVTDGWRIVDGKLDLLPLFARLVDEPDPRRGAALLYATAAAGIADWLQTQAPSGSCIAAAGGCLQNQVFARELRYRLGQCGMNLIEALRVPPSGGGLSLGQAWVAQRYLLGSTPASSSPENYGRRKGDRRQAAPHPAAISSSRETDIRKANPDL